MRVQHGPGLQEGGGSFWRFRGMWVGDGEERCAVERGGLYGHYVTLVFFNLWGHFWDVVSLINTHNCFKFIPSPKTCIHPYFRSSFLPLFILFPSPPLSLSSAPPLLPLSACCPESKWQQLSLNAKPRSHAKLTPQVFWLTLSVHQAWLPSAPLVGSDRSPRGVRHGEGRGLVF